MTAGLAGGHQGLQWGTVVLPCNSSPSKKQQLKLYDVSAKRSFCKFVQNL